MAKSQRSRHPNRSSRHPPRRPKHSERSSYNEPPRRLPEHHPEQRREHRPEYRQEHRPPLPPPPPPPRMERQSRGEMRPPEHRGEERPPQPREKRRTEMGIDMFVLENIDKNPHVSVDRLSYELGVDRQEILASIRRLRSDRARFQEVQKRVETKRFHKVVKEHTENGNEEYYEENYEY